MDGVLRGDEHLREASSVLGSKLYAANRVMSIEKHRHLGIEEQWGHLEHLDAKADPTTRVRLQRA